MPTRIYKLKGEIVMIEPISVCYDEVVVSELWPEDSPIIEDWKIIPLVGSATHKKQLIESEKMMYEMQRQIEESKKWIILNVTTEDGKPNYVVHKPTDEDYASIKYSPDNGDMRFSTMSEVKKYISSLK